MRVPKCRAFVAFLVSGSLGLPVCVFSFSYILSASCLVFGLVLSESGRKHVRAKRGFMIVPRVRVRTSQFLRAVSWLSIDVAYLCVFVAFDASGELSCVSPWGNATPVVQCVGAWSHALTMFAPLATMRGPALGETRAPPRG
eukprot:1880586-Pleurochrysis_carterae.AAC.1